MDMVEDADTLQKREDIIMKYENVQGHRAGLPADMGPKPVGIYSSTYHFGILQSGQPPFQDQNSSLAPLQVQPEVVVRPEVWGPSMQRLIDRVYKGIPMNIQGQVWSVLLNIQEIKMKNPRKYQVMKEKSKRSSEHIHQIYLNMSWTLGNHIFFRDRHGVKIPQPKWQDSSGAPRPSGACGAHVTTQDHVSSAKPEKGSSGPRSVLASRGRKTLCKGDRQALPGPPAWFQRPICTPTKENYYGG
uniref:Rab-GAP TBC domain-containing protein n=1 Tax=Pongo abelii TaxID=9601 RepID=A0A8I5TL11_PONAB